MFKIIFRSVFLTWSSGVLLIKLSGEGEEEVLIPDTGALGRVHGLPSEALKKKDQHYLIMKVHEVCSQPIKSNK